MKINHKIGLGILLSIVTSYSSAAFYLSQPKECETTGSTLSTKAELVSVQVQINGQNYTLRQYEISNHRPPYRMQGPFTNFEHILINTACFLTSSDQQEHCIDLKKNITLTRDKKGNFPTTVVFEIGCKVNGGQITRVSAVNTKVFYPDK